MGFLKKITRPISRVLDKIVPNELKPALPFLAAAAPFMAPGLMSIGGGTMFSRALMSGGLNLGAQLAQEGSEGDFSGLSTLMAAATGALSTPGSAGGRTLPDGSGGSYSQVMGGDKLASTGTQSAGDFFKNKALGMEPGLTKSGLGALETSSNYLSGVGDTLQNNLFSKEGLKAALIPAGQGMTDLAVAENRRALKAYEQDLADYEASMGDQATDEGRALAIRTAMLRYGFTEDEILDTISSAGYRAGGRVGLKDGSSTGSFGTDRYISEMLSEGNTLANRGENFMSEYDEMVKSGKIDSSIFDKLKEYKDMQKTEENLEKKFSNENLENVAEENLDKDALKYYDKKVNKLEKKFDDLNEKEEGIIALTNKNQFDASEITKTPDFQNWLRVYNSEDKMKAFDHPYADIYLSILDVKLKGRNESQRDLVGLADGGLMNLGGREMDMRGGGFIPIGKKERADDVPARLSKNEFVMTADAVRAAGGGSVNEGAKRMYETMNRLEARA